MVSSGDHCNDVSGFIVDDPSSISHCNGSSLDFNTYSLRNDLHACVDSPCISCVSCLNKSNDDMLALYCGHDKNASISSSCCVTNNVEETKYSIGQDKILKGASSKSSSLSHGSHICLMAKSSMVSPTVEPNISCGDKDEDEYEEEDWVVSLRDCYHQNLTESEVGRDQDGLEESTWKKYVNRPFIPNWASLPLYHVTYYIAS